MAFGYNTNPVNAFGIIHFIDNTSKYIHYYFADETIPQSITLLPMKGDYVLNIDNLEKFQYIPHIEKNQRIMHTIVAKSGSGKSMFTANQVKYLVDNYKLVDGLKSRNMFTTKVLKHVKQIKDDEDFQDMEVFLFTSNLGENGELDPAYKNIKNLTVLDVTDPEIDQLNISELKECVVIFDDFLEAISNIPQQVKLVMHILNSLLANSRKRLVNLFVCIHELYAGIRFKLLMSETETLTIFPSSDFAQIRRFVTQKMKQNSPSLMQELIRLKNIRYSNITFRRKTPYFIMSNRFLASI